MSWVEVALRDVAAAGTCAGVIVAALALRRQARQARSTFEDELVREYREIA